MGTTLRLWLYQCPARWPKEIEGSPLGNKSTREVTATENAALLILVDNSVVLVLRKVFQVPLSGTRCVNLSLQFFPFGHGVCEGIFKSGFPGDFSHGIRYFL